MSGIETVLNVYLVVSLACAPFLVVCILIKLHDITELLKSLAQNQLAVSTGTRALCETVDILDKNVDVLWDAVFPDDDPDDEENIDDGATNVVALGKRKVA